MADQESVIALTELERTMVEFDDEFQIETPADFDMNNFLIEIGVKSQDTPEIIREGFTEVEDLQS
ncbi:MAG: hypothetical protein ACREOZ_02725, partial [Gloeomargaritales cyanobacterium]